MKKVIPLLFAIFCSAALLVVVGPSWFLGQKVNIAEAKVFNVQRGQSLHSVSRSLAEEGIINNPWLFVKAIQVGQYSGASGSAKIRYGEYDVTPGMTYAALLELFNDGKTRLYSITFREGEHIFDYAKSIEESGLGTRQEFLALVTNREFVKQVLGKDHESLEGYLFPETYKYRKTDNLKTMVKAMVDNYKAVRLNIAPSRHPFLSPHEVVILASIIEKETGAGFERPLISSVFHNRLKKKMRLQTDPTIIYGILRESGNEINNIRKSDLKRPTPYNTYVINGLPPGPIGNPGKEALQAALSPEKSPYLYFVSRNDGTHVFTSTYKDHLKAVKKFQLDPSMRRGRSWRDLKKKEEGQ